MSAAANGGSTKRASPSSLKGSRRAAADSRCAHRCAGRPPFPAAQELVRHRPRSPRALREPPQSSPTVISPHSQRRRPAPDTLHALSSTFGDRCDAEANLATSGLLVNLAEPRRSTRSAAAVLPRLHGAIAVDGLRFPQKRPGNLKFTNVQKIAFLAHFLADSVLESAAGQAGQVPQLGEARSHGG